MSKRMGFDVEREMKHLKKIVERDDSVKITSRFTKYLIEQAERVQELEQQTDVSVELELLNDTICRLERQNNRYRELLTSKIMKDLIRLERKGCFFPDEKRTDFINFKLSVEALEESE